MKIDTLEFRFAFFAKDFDRSVSFYRDRLGMEYLRGWDRPDDKGALLSAGGIAVVEIFGTATGTDYTGPRPAAVNLALRVASREAVDRAYNEFTRAGCHLGKPPHDQPWGHYGFPIYDPDEIPVYIYCEIDIPEGAI